MQRVRLVSASYASACSLPQHNPVAVVPVVAVVPAVVGVDPARRVSGRAARSGVASVSVGDRGEDAAAGLDDLEASIPNAAKHRHRLHGDMASIDQLTVLVALAAVPRGLRGRAARGALPLGIVLARREPEPCPKKRGSISESDESFAISIAISNASANT